MATLNKKNQRKIQFLLMNETIVIEDPGHSWIHLCANNKGIKVRTHKLRENVVEVTRIN